MRFDTWRYYWALLVATGPHPSLVGQGFGERGFPSQAIYLSKQGKQCRTVRRLVETYLRTNNNKCLKFISWKKNPIRKLEKKSWLSNITIDIKVRLVEISCEAECSLMLGVASGPAVWASVLWGKINTAGNVADSCSRGKDLSLMVSLQMAQESPVIYPAVAAFTNMD